MAIANIFLENVASKLGFDICQTCAINDFSNFVFVMISYIYAEVRWPCYWVSNMANIYL